jgi:hypothetical protein
MQAVEAAGTDWLHLVAMATVSPISDRTSGQIDSRKVIEESVGSELCRNNPAEAPGAWPWGKYLLFSPFRVLP